MAKRSDQPNLLFIFSDQQRADTMAAYGNDWIETPAMNRLADTGSVIENCYVYLSRRISDLHSVAFHHHDRHLATHQRRIQEQRPAAR